MEFKKRMRMESVAFKKRTRDEIVAAFRESLRKKQEWQVKAEESIQRIRQERQQLCIWQKIKSNPRLVDIMVDFKETIDILTDKPESVWEEFFCFCWC